MKTKDIVSALRTMPFKPIVINSDGNAFPVNHPEQCVFTTDQQTLIIAGQDNTFHILDVSHISSISSFKRTQRPKAA